MSQNNIGYDFECILYDLVFFVWSDIMPEQSDFGQTFAKMVGNVLFLTVISGSVNAIYWLSYTYSNTVIAYQKSLNSATVIIIIAKHYLSHFTNTQGLNRTSTTAEQQNYTKFVK